MRFIGNLRKKKEREDSEWPCLPKPWYWVHQWLLSYVRRNAPVPAHKLGLTVPEKSDGSHSKDDNLSSWLLWKLARNHLGNSGKWNYRSSGILWISGITNFFCLFLGITPNILSWSSLLQDGNTTPFFTVSMILAYTWIGCPHLWKDNYTNKKPKIENLINAQVILVIYEPYLSFSQWIRGSI